MQREINKALETLKKGGTILYPTDTIWGIGCDATNAEAVQRIFKIKKRTKSKALISLISNKEQLSKLVNLNKQYPKEGRNPTTVIYQNVIGLAKNLLANNSSAAIRIVQDSFCKELIQRFNKPIVSTSANISNERFPKRFSDISKEIINNVDYIVNLRQNEIMDVQSKIISINNDGTIKRLR